MFYKCKKHLYILVVFAIGFVGVSFRVETEPDAFQWIEACIKSCFDCGSGISKLKRWDLAVTNKGFFRLKKYYLNGKQEYFSFNLSRLSDFNYLGSEEAGEIVLKTKSDDIIVQTYNDPKGNVDSMSSCLKINTIHVKPESLDSLWTKLRIKSME